jgi:hypothetical protein
MLQARMRPSPILVSSAPVDALDSIELATANGSIKPSAPTGWPKLTLIDGQDTPSKPSGKEIPRKAR